MNDTIQNCLHEGKIMNKILLITTLLTSMPSTATTLIFEPGQPMQAIEPTSNGYIIMDVGG